jgi:tetratricopeptide (TPR) repeat protein
MFARHATTATVDGLLLELEPLKRELKEFTLFDKSYSMLDEGSRELLLRSSLFEEAVHVEALSWMIGNKEQPSPPIDQPLDKLLRWGLISRQEEQEEIFYSVHTLVREFVWQKVDGKEVDRKILLIRAAQYYENLAKITKNIWILLKARDYYYKAEVWDTADSIINSAFPSLLLWGHNELALKQLNQSIETTGGTRKATALTNVGIIYQGVGDLATATKLYNEAKEIFQKEGAEEKAAGVMHQLGSVHYSQGNYAEAMELYEESQSIMEKLGKKELIAHSLYAQGMIHQDKGNYDAAINLYEKSLKLAREKNDTKLMANVLNMLGNLFQESLRIKKTLGDRKGYATTLHNLARINAKEGNDQKAIELYHESLEIKKEVSDIRGIAESFGQLGRLHEKNQDYDTALDHYIQALLIFEQLNHPYSEIARSDIARVKEKMGQEAFEKSVEDFRRRHGT